MEMLVLEELPHEKSKSPKNMKTEEEYVDTSWNNKTNDNPESFIILKFLESTRKSSIVV